MARRVPRPPVALALALTLAPPLAARDGVTSGDSRALVSYSFEDELATGPDTFAVFQRSAGRVNLTRALRFSGYRAVEIEDVAGDGEFPELQGYFSLRESGKVYAHFALLATDAQETLNVALAGPRGFALGKDAIAFWLLSRDGFLCHVSDSMPKKLFEIRPFVWYLVDVAYDIDAGRYDLAIREEGARDALVHLVGQVNAASQPGSGVDKFSFIGDSGEDTSNVVYYVDDVVVALDEPVLQADFVAPGRRKLFVDAWSEWQKLVRKRPGCLPALTLADLGVGTEQAAALEREGALAAFDDLLGAGALEARGLSLPTAAEPRRLLEGALLHRRGCAALAEGQAEAAFELVDSAAELVPEAKLYELAAALALAKLERFEEADARLGSIEPEFQNDPRFALAAAMVGLARDDLDEAERWLGPAAEEAREADLDGPLPEQYFFVLLWKGSWRKAERYATRIEEELAAAGRPSALWLERTGDAAFLAGDVETARRSYEQSLEEQPGSSLLLTKLSDVYFLLGDLEEERALREAVYGRLAE